MPLKSFSLDIPTVVAGTPPAFFAITSVVESQPLWAQLLFTVLTVLAMAALKLVPVLAERIVSRYVSDPQIKNQIAEAVQEAVEKLQALLSEKDQEIESLKETIRIMRLGEGFSDPSSPQ